MNETLTISGRKRKPSYKEVYDYFRKQAAEAGDGILIPTRAKLAEQFGVAEGTVSKAIDLLKNQGFVYGQQGKGTYLCQKEKVRGCMRKIAFLTYVMDVDIVQYSKGFNKVFYDDECSLATHSSYTSVKRFENAIRQALADKVGGIILHSIPAVRGVSQRDVALLIKANVPVVVIGGDFIQGLHCDRVHHTRRDSAKKIAEYVVQRQYKMPGIFLESSMPQQDNDEFIREIAYTFKENSLTISEDKIFSVNTIYWDSDHSDYHAGAYEFAKENLSKISDCDVLIFQGDGAATGVLRALLDNGIRVPEQIKLLSGHRHRLVDEKTRMRITAVDTCVEEQAFCAARLLERRMAGYDGPFEVHYIKGELVEGETT